MTGELTWRLEFDGLAICSRPVFGWTRRPRNEPMGRVFWLGFVGVVFVNALRLRGR